MKLFKLEVKLQIIAMLFQDQQPQIFLILIIMLKKDLKFNIPKEMNVLMLQNHQRMIKKQHFILNAMQLMMILSP